MAAVCFQKAEIVSSQLWIEVKTANINMKNSKKNNFIVIWTVDILRTAHCTALEMIKFILAVLHVSLDDGLTRCYKTAV